jgi:hypothetical protein
VLSAVQDLLEQTPDVNVFLRQKLQYADTDIARFSNCAMRMRQFCESLANRSDASVSHRGFQWTVYDVLYGVRLWLRQIMFHAGFYRYCATWQKASPEPLATLPSPAASLELADKVALWILRDCRFNKETSTAQIRTWLRNRPGVSAGLIHSTVEKLVGMTILLRAEPDAPPAASQAGRLPGETTLSLKVPRCNLSIS